MRARGLSLFGLAVLIIGSGGIAREFARMVEPFEVELLVCQRTATPFASRSFTPDELHSHLPDAVVVLLAAPLTSDTRGLMNAAAFSAMKSSAVLVNVARGGLVVTDNLVTALRHETIAGAALDVTDPEPLPAGHPLWSHPAALITPHSADTPEMIVPLLADRIVENVRRFAAGEPLVGVIDVITGY